MEGNLEFFYIFKQQLSNESGSGLQTSFAT